MPRKKKTKEAKKKADIRNMAAVSAQTTHEHGASLYSYTVHQHAPLTPSERATMPLDTIALVKKDVLTTALISSTILVVQLVLFFLLKNHILAIGFVRY